MEKKSLRKGTTCQQGSAFETMADKPEDVPWPCISGPRVPNTDPKLWKSPRLDMNSSLAFLRRELADMQLQDRALHKQLLALNSTILGLKTALNESWEQEEKSEVEIEAVCYPTQTTSTVTKVEVINTTNRELHREQVSHSKQDSGILTEDSEEEGDILVSEPEKVQKTREQSVSVMNLPSYYSLIDVDINNNNKRTQGKRSGKTNNITNSNTFQAFNLSVPRPKPYAATEGQFHRVTSMPVINEIPGQDTPSSKMKGKAFAIFGYMGDTNMNNNSRTSLRVHPLNIKPLSRHESMPIIPAYSESRTVRHNRSQTEPIHFQRGLFNSSFSGHPTQSSDRPVARASSQMDLRRIDQQQVKPYRLYRTSSQVTLV